MVLSHEWDVSRRLPRHRRPWWVTHPVPEGPVLQLEAEPGAARVVVLVSGEIDALTAPHLEAFVAGRSLAGCGVLELDLAGVTSIASAGLSALLGLRRTIARGYVLLGANPLARHVALRLAEAGEPVELIDQDSDDSRAAQEAGLKVIFGSELEPRTLARAQIDARSYAAALTPNQGINLLFARHVSDELPGPHVLAPVDPEGASPELLRARGARMLFATPVSLGAWIARWRRGHVDVIRRVFAGSAPDMPFPPPPPDLILPLLVDRAGALSLVDDRTRLTAGDVVEVAIVADRRAEAEAYFASGPWHLEAEVQA